MAEEVHIATGEFPPLYTEHSETNGIVLQLVSEALQTVKLEARFHFRPWARANYDAKSRRFDASCCWFAQEERAKHAHYSDPVFAYSYSFFHLRAITFDWNLVEDLTGYKLGGTGSYTYTAEFTQAEKNKIIDVQRTSSDLKNLHMLLAGRIDAFPLNTDVGYYILKHEFSKKEAESITHHPKPLMYNYVHLVAPKQSPDSLKLIDAFNRGLILLKASGRYQQLIDAYEESRQQTSP